MARHSGFGREGVNTRPDPVARPPRHLPATRPEGAWGASGSVDAIHYDLLQQHGGVTGIRDENALESALARPRQRWAYELGADLAVVAAACGFGMATNDAYSDGNKRVAFIAMYAFLGVNGLEIVAAEPEVVDVMRNVAAGQLDEAALATWLREHVAPFVE